MFAADSTSARVFFDYMLSVGNNLSRATAEEIPALLKSTIGLLDLLSLRNDAGSGMATDATLRTACRYIDGHLGDPALGADGICKHMRCSRATLYRLFRPHGGVRQYIQHRRLMACFNAVSSPNQGHRRIFDIALDFGFASPSQFSHLFRGHFGMTPRDARDASRRLPLPAAPFAMPAGSGGHDDAERMWQWAKTLAGQAGFAPLQYEAPRTDL